MNQKETFRVCSFNVHSCIGADKRYAPERILEVVESINADLVALQEVPDPYPTGSVSLYKLLAEHTGYHLLSGITLKKGSGDFGNLLLSRFPVINSEKLDLSYIRREPRGAIIVTVKTGSEQLQFVATHLGLRARERKQQIDSILKNLAVNCNRTIIAADFNEWNPFSSNLRKLKHQFDFSPARRTFPSCFPVLPLDRIMAGQDLRITDCSVFKFQKTSPASDHLPLIATVEIRDSDGKIH